MTEKELCGQPTSSGLPCNMPKGHRVHYHRHRGYDTITWTIETTKGVTLESGSARVPLNNAIALALKSNESIVVNIKRWLDGSPVQASGTA